MENTSNTQAWNQLLIEAVSTPGKIHEAYRYFHNYSLGNAMMALWQCAIRGIQPGPINTFMGWKELGRNVRKGQKAISLWMPITSKATRKNDKGEDETYSFVRFVIKPHWFVLSQTEGAEYAQPEVPNFDLEKMLRTLDITRVDFEQTNGNAQGYALRRTVAVSPIAAMPEKTLFHEVAHVILGHTETMMSDSDATPRNLQEVEAESVALLCCESLGLDGAEYCRGYIQNWLQGSEIPEKSAQKIFSAAAEILKAGK